MFDDLLRPGGIDEPVEDPKKVLVVGGGIAGMQAASILARRGHTVVLVEQELELGGQGRYSRRVQPEVGDLVVWLARQLYRSGVEVRLGIRADAALLQELDPDTVIVAVGAHGAGSRLRANDRSIPEFDLFSAFDRPMDEWEGTIVVAGLDSPSCYLGIQLASTNHELRVIVVGADPHVGGTDRPSPLHGALAEWMARTPNLEVLASSTVESVQDGIVSGQTNGDPFAIRAGTLVIGGRNPRFALLQEMKAAGLRASIRAIGDAIRPRDVFTASSEAAMAADATVGEPPLGLTRS